MSRIHRAVPLVLFVAFLRTDLPRVDACGGAPPPPRCGKTVAIGKAVPRVVVQQPGQPVNVPITGLNYVGLTEFPPGSGACPTGPITATISLRLDLHYLLPDGEVVRVHPGETKDTVPTFRRGDANGNGSNDLSDGVRQLQVLFQGAAPSTCEDSADSNDDGQTDIADATFIFSWLFLGGRAMPSPGVACGPDPTDDRLTCESYDSCP